MGRNDTSSAVARALIGYANTAADINAGLTGEARKLEAALSAFAATCTEYKTDAGPQLAGALHAYVRRTAPADEWVRQVGRDFARADGGRQDNVSAPVFAARQMPPATSGAKADQGSASPWATAFPAAGSSTLGPVPVPIPGKRGRVPPGYANAGKRLFLYAGKSGTDTIFGIHPRKKWATNPKNRPKPNLRFDYGPIYTKSGTAPLPNGKTAPIKRGPNYFHWNQQGNMGQVNRPLMRTLGGGAIRDHQLMTNKTAPRPNVMGSIRGGTLVRGASRGLFVVGAAVDTYNIATADNKVKESVKVAAGWAGAWAGAKGGAVAGAAIGSVFPGPGTAIGGVVGGVIGGAIGYVAGSELGEKLYDAGDKIVEGIGDLFDW